MSMAAHDTESARSRDLLDQLHLRAGYLALNNEEYDKALGFLEKVSLDSYHAPRALYLHGLALSGKENHRGAMQSWHRAKKFPLAFPDRKSTRLNSSHVRISYAVFCLKK